MFQLPRPFSLNFLEYKSRIHADRSRDHGRDLVVRPRRRSLRLFICGSYKRYEPSNGRRHDVALRQDGGVQVHSFHAASVDEYDRLRNAGHRGRAVHPVVANQARYASNGNGHDLHSKSGAHAPSKRAYSRDYAGQPDLLNE